MPYKKRTTKKAPYRSTQKTKPMRYKVADTALAAWKGVQTIRKLINVEQKFYDIESNNVNVTTTGTIIPLAFIGQGTTENTRQGNSIKPQSLVIRGTYQSDSSFNSDQWIRMLVVRVKQDNGVTPVLADFFSTATNVYSLYNPNERMHWECLYDKLHHVPIGGYSGTTMKQQFTIKMPLTGHVHYVDGASTYESGGLHFIFLSDNTTGADYSIINYHTRVKWTDN